MRPWILAAAVLALPLSGCSPSSPDADLSAHAADHLHTARSKSASAPASPGPTEQFHSVAYGFRIDYPAGTNLQRDFRHGYFQNDAWKAFAGPDSKGTPVVDLILSGSDHITSGELRIGASRDPQAVDRCTQPPDTVHGSPATRELNGAAFTYFEAGDAAMNHYMRTRSYRLVHDGACIAIDLVVSGTRPEVYDPPAKPPFSQDEAFRRLHGMLAGFRFTL